MKLLELYNQILESKRTELGAEKILQTFYDSNDRIYNAAVENGFSDLSTLYKVLKEPKQVIEKLKKLDTSEGQKNLEPMAYLVGLSMNPQDPIKVNFDHYQSTFEDYNDLLGRQKIEPIVVSKKKGLRIGDNGPFGDFLSFQEYIHGQKNLYGQKDKRSGELVVNIDDKPVFNKNGIEIYDAFDVGRCIKYGYTSQIDKGMKPYSFCISDPKMRNNMWQSYRDSKGSTFYFIFDKNRDAEDPLHMVVFDNTSNRGVELTDANNTTGSIAEFGRDVNGYINYLESKGVSARDLMPNREYSDSEKEEGELLGRKNEDLTWFMKLPLDYKEKYIGRGHRLTPDQFIYISPNKDLVSKYIQLGHILDDEQFEKLNSNQKKSYMRARMNMITHYFNENDDWQRKYWLEENRFSEKELSSMSEDIRVEYILKLAEFLPLKNYEFNYVPVDKRLYVKKGSYMRDAKKDTVKNISKDADFPNKDRYEVTKLYLETRLSRGHGKKTMVEAEMFNYLTNEQQDSLMKGILENGMIFSPDDWETTIPKRFLKAYIEMIGTQGGSYPDEEAIPQALMDLFIQTMGDNNNWMNSYSLKGGSQDAIDYYLLKGLEQAHPEANGINITSDMLALGSDKVKQMYYNRFDKRLGHWKRDNVKRGNSPYHKVSVEDIEFASPEFREEWYLDRIKNYGDTIEKLSNMGEDMVSYSRDAVRSLMDGIISYGKRVMPDTSDAFRKEAFSSIYNMGNTGLGVLVKKEFNTSEFKSFVRRYAPKMESIFAKLVPADARFNVWRNKD